MSWVYRHQTIVRSAAMLLGAIVNATVHVMMRLSGHYIKHIIFCVCVCGCPPAHSLDRRMTTGHNTTLDSPDSIFGGSFGIQSIHALHE